MRPEPVLHARSQRKRAQVVSMWDLVSSGTPGARMRVFLELKIPPPSGKG